MSTVAGGSVAARELFAGLFDDAALFPPGNAAMVRAVPAHLAYGRTTQADLVGPFLCPASRLDELCLTLDDDGILGVTVIADTGTGGVADAVAAVAGDRRLELRGVEIALRAEHDLGTSARRTVAAVLDAGLPDDTAVFVEVPRWAPADPVLDLLAEYGLSAKLRTGGVDASAYPDETEVAAFLLACLDREVTVKCTAGLHHAVRNTADDTGFEQHGFLNLLLAVRAALDGADEQGVADELGDRDRDAVAARVRALTPDRATRTRAWFRSFGTCSIDEPVEDLRALGLIDREPS